MGRERSGETANSKELFSFYNTLPLLATPYSLLADRLLENRFSHPGKTSPPAPLLLLSGASHFCKNTVGGGAGERGRI
jgi:hypothetical protein